jgi:hypothetical protein
MPPASPAPSSAARTLHALLLTSTLIISIGAFVVSRSIAALSSAVGVLDWVAILVGLSGLAIALLLRSRLPARTGGQTADQWWSANLGRAVALWALFEFPAMLGSVTLFVTGHLIPFIALVALALGGLVSLAPGRLGGD